MRTYYELEDWHWDMIKKAGFKKGMKVWVARDDYYYDVAEGTIKEFDVHIEGEVEIRVAIPDNIASSRFFMFQVKKTEEEAWDVLEKIAQTRVEAAESKLKYRKNNQKEIAKKRAKRYKHRPRRKKGSFAKKVGLGARIK